MKIFGLLIVFSTLTVTSFASLAVSPSTANWLYDEAKSQMASSYLYENIGAFR